MHGSTSMSDWEAHDAAGARKRGHDAAGGQHPAAGGGQQGRASAPMSDWEEEEEDGDVHLPHPRVRASALWAAQACVQRALPLRVVGLSEEVGRSRREAGVVAKVRACWDGGG